MKDGSRPSEISRRELLLRGGKAAAMLTVLPPLVHDDLGMLKAAEVAPAVKALAGPDRILVLPGKTYLNGWAGYGNVPNVNAPERRRVGDAAATPETGPDPKLEWKKLSGPGDVTFGDAHVLNTTASFSKEGEYVLQLVADNGETKAESQLRVIAEKAPGIDPLLPVYTKNYKIGEGLWKDRTKVLIATWIPYCIDMCNRTDLELGPGGIDNFVEAGKALRGEPHGEHKGYVFSNAWVYQTIEAMAIALMIDPQGDPEILAAHAKFRKTLDEWIPIVLAAAEPDGYIQTAYTLKLRGWNERFAPRYRSNHEGYVAGYFLEAALNHHMMTKGQDLRLYNAAKKLADCWVATIGPAPKKPWYDGHQEMEQALVRFGHFVNEVEGGHKGDNYITLAKFLIDSRAGGNPYDQSHLPAAHQYEAVGHAVRAVYSYSAMADVAIETRDVDYTSAVRSLWDNIVNRKYYVTGGVGSGETSEGFGPDYSLRNNAYCESCSSCGELFFQSKMNRIYGESKYADCIEDSIFNALLGSYDLEGKNFYYQNPLAENRARYPWHACPCCVGNIPRTLLMIPTWSYLKSADSIYVNLFIPHTTVVEGVAGTDVELEQVTKYPWAGQVSITVNPKVSKRFSMRVRMPDREVSKLYQLEPHANGITKLAVNGQAIKPTVEGGYAVITREWKKGDRIEFELPMQVQRIHADPKIEADRGLVALRYGPLIYALEREDQDIMQALPRTVALTTEHKPDLLRGVTVIKGTLEGGTPFMAIPYYARYNRQLAKEPPPARPAQGERPAPRPPASIVWVKEA